MDDLMTASTTAPTDKLAKPAPGLYPVGVRPYRILWGYAFMIVLLHFLSLLVFVPWFFSWTGFVTFLLTPYVFGMLGITLGYHRLLTHRGFTCPKWFEHLLAILGVCSLQDSPARWVAIHRKHHQFSDDRPDPHSPRVNFLWSHCGWLFVDNRELSTAGAYERYARDVLRDPFYMWLERKLMWFWVYVLHAALFFVTGLAIGWTTSGSYWEGVRFGASLLVWGVFFRTVVSWHGTWAVNSLSHIWGYQNYETGDNSRNNWLVSLLAFGEGWHNNHHAQQRSAAHGHKWWEFDVTYKVIRLLEAVGLARDVIRPQSDSTK